MKKQNPLDQKRCPTLQKIRIEMLVREIDKLSEENMELKEKVTNWKFRSFLFATWFIIHLLMEAIREV